MTMPEKPMKGQMVILDGNAFKFKGGDPASDDAWEHVPYGPKTMQQSMQEEVGSRGAWDKFWGGVGGKMDAYAYGAKGLFTDLPKEEQERVDLGKETRKTLPGAIGGAAVDVAATYPLFGTLAAQTARMGPLARDLTQIVGAGTIGGGAGAVSNPGDRVGGAVREGLGAATGMGIAQGARGVWAPGVGSTADALQAQGVRLTPGQSAGGVVKKAEDANNLFNPSVARRQGEGIADWNRVEIDKKLTGAGLPPAGQSGHDGLKAAQKTFSNEYKRVGTPLVTGDQTYAQALDDLLVARKPFLTPEQVTTLEGEIAVAKNMAGGQKNTSAFRDFEQSMLSKASENTKHPELAKAYEEIAKRMEGLRGQVGAVTPELDYQYAQFSRMKEAAGMKGAMDTGVFSPEQLKSSIRAASETNQRAFGEALMQKDTAKAREVLGPTIPEVGSGTMEKGVLGVGLPSALAYAITTGNWGPLAAGAGLYGANKLAYSPLGVNLLVGNNPYQRAIGPEWQAALAASGGALADPALSRKRR
jgi:hypothetical protein